ncbi:MAG: VacJ family lipoprotein [Gammaproteobacteria bacterium]|nr:VacJ family lipoprotein [Gammaproteobacteria bacterium]MBU1655286.1 VacJ family lipoprotein [Gammaproteobacteria bacterium]MBU1962065.1 VacJ family lipoprotein [Gammaproteobacteria bacterium]
MTTKLRVQTILLVGLLAILAGCATNGERDPRDPWEGYNRGMYNFNDKLDRAILKPLAKGYQAITPDPVDRGVTNFFSNLADVNSAVNNILQFKLARASSDVWRVIINSTIGLFGVVDVASKLHLDKYGEDFGQTFGYWGVGPGPYFVWPLLGPSTVRDSVGMVGDWYMDPVNYVDPDALRYGLKGLRIIDKRADLLSASNVLEEAALDPYAFVRDAYLQKREDQVEDGASDEPAPGEAGTGEIPEKW